MIPSMPRREEEAENVAGSALSPTDSGRDAWLVLTACTVMEALVWGETFLSAKGVPTA